MEAFVDELLRLGENLLPSDTPSGIWELLRDVSCLKPLPTAFRHRTLRLGLFAGCGPAPSQKPLATLYRYLPAARSADGLLP